LAPFPRATVGIKSARTAAREPGDAEASRDDQHPPITAPGAPDMRMTRLIVVVATVAVCGWTAHAQDFSTQNRHGNGTIHVSATLHPSNEVPSVSSPAEGHFSAEIDTVNDEITYEMTFSGLQAPVTQSHIHFAQRNVNGAIVVWLCGTATNPGPAGTQTCPQSGTISGVIHGSDIQTVPSQGIATGEFDELVNAIRNGLAYANIHTMQSPGGEMRGQLQRGNGHD
jgi:hypothetical protein